MNKFHRIKSNGVIQFCSSKAAGGENLDEYAYKPLRIKYQRVCELLDITRQQLDKMVECDLNFPRPIKSGNTKQAGVYYFDWDEIERWYLNWKLENRK